MSGPAAVGGRVAPTATSALDAAASLLVSGDPCAALLLARRALELDVGVETGASVIGDARALIRRAEDALNARARRDEPLASCSQTFSPACERAFGEAMEAHARGDVGRAVELYAAAAREDGRCFLAPLNAGAVLHMRGRDREALPWLQRAVAAVPRLVPALRKLGVSLAALGERREAADAFHRALDADPGDARVRVLTAEQLLACGEVEACVDGGSAPLSAAALAPTERGNAFGCYPLGMRGNALLWLGRSAEAREALRAARRGGPAQAPWAFVLARAEEGARARQAAQDFRALLREAHDGALGAACEPQDSLCAANNKLDAPHWERIDDKAALHALLTSAGAPRWCAAAAPATFALPGELDALRTYDGAARAAAAAAGRAPPRWYLKERMAHGGAGNTLLGEMDAAALNRLHAAVAACAPPSRGRSELLAQRAVDRPMLIEGRKFSLRLYVVALALAPLRAYVAREGLCLLAAAPFGAPDPHAHITNQSFNSSHPAYRSAHGEGEGGNTRPLAALRAAAEAHGVAFEAVWRACAARCAAALASAQGALTASYGDVASAGVDRVGLPKILGVDLLVDQWGTPWLLECNRHAALGERGAVDHRVKRNVTRAAWEAALERAEGRSAETSFSGDGFDWRAVLQPLDLERCEVAVPIAGIDYGLPTLRHVGLDDIDSDSD